MSSRCRHELKFGNYDKNIAPKLKRAARAARLFFLIQPIIFLICDAVVPVSVVVSLTLQTSIEQFPPNFQGFLLPKRTLIIK